MKIRCGRYGAVALAAVAVVVSLQAQRNVAADVATPSADVRAAQEVLARVIDVHIDHLPLDRAINAIAARSGAQIDFWSNALPRNAAPVTVHASRITVGDALDRVLAGTTLRVVPLRLGRIGIVADGREFGAVAQGRIQGSVRDTKTQQPIRGAQIGLDDAGRMTETGEDGGYHIDGVSAGAHTVTVKHLGYAKASRRIVVQNEATTSVDVSLDLSAMALDQVVVTGTVIQTELKAVPNAITVITAKQIEERGITKIDQLFRGDVPGLFAQNQGANALLDEVTMYSRGVTSASRYDLRTGVDGKFTNPIKTYVDGVEVADARYLSQIDPKSIERIEILTGPQASTIYGSNAINGVMQIFTKRGTSSTPQLTLNFLSGWIENDFRPTRTPQHDYGAQLSGIEGHLSYNGGGSWQYVGPWTPAKQTTRRGGFGGARLDFSTLLGHVTSDVTLRDMLTQNQQHGDAQQTYTGYRETGFYKTSDFVGLTYPTINSLVGQTFGLAFGFVPTVWWSHEVGLGQDVENVEARQTVAGNLVPGDTNLSLTQTRMERRSLKYTTTIHVPITMLAQATVTTGVDAWRNLMTSLSTSAPSFSGQFVDRCLAYGFSCTQLQRQPGHNNGGFLQAQFGFKDQLFFTYGLRAEWNPDYGAEALPSYAPRYGMAYTQVVGPVTAKLRASYGRSTRPPGLSLKSSMNATAQYGAQWQGLSEYGNFDYHLANPALGPEFQQGGEGGLEMYIGSRGSLIITRYNQTVDGLIDQPAVDSVRSIVADPLSGAQSYDQSGYGYFYQYQALNVGSIRNQGWELQGGLNVGPFTTKGTYSWTKSRMIGVSSKYRSYFPLSSYPQYQPGATFRFLPEHTWALGITYGLAQTTLALNVSGTGQLEYGSGAAFFFRNITRDIRLQQNRLRASGGSFILFNNGYSMIDLMASHQFVRQMECVLQIQNMTNRYINDTDAQYPTMGRQLKAGLRWHL